MSMATRWSTWECEDHQCGPGEVGHHGSQDPAGRETLEAEEDAHHDCGNDKGDVAGGGRDDDVDDGRSRRRMVRLEGGVERAAKEQLLAYAVDQRDEQHKSGWVGIG